MCKDSDILKIRDTYLRLVLMGVVYLISPHNQRLPLLEELYLLRLETKPSFCTPVFPQMTGIEIVVLTVT
jgi:hypothetical protein